MTLDKTHPPFPSPPTPPTPLFSPSLYPVWSLDILQTRRSLYGLPSPRQRLPLATSTAAVAGVKKLVSAPTLALVKEMCVCVCLFARVCVVVVVTDIIVVTVCVCVFFGAKERRLRCKKSPPIGRMSGRERDGRSAINFPPLLEKVTGSRHCGSQLRRNTTNRTRGAPVRGRARRAGGQTKTGMEMQLHITQVRTKAWRQPRRHHSNTSVDTHPRWHAHKHTLTKVLLRMCR